MSTTRSVFALILINFKETGKKILLSERRDGKGWKLPGGDVNEGEDDRDALVREVRVETGLVITVIEQLGPPHVSNEGTAVAYICDIAGGYRIPTKKAKQHRSVDKEEIKSLKLVGQVDQLGCMGRMTWDGLSILEDPKICPHGADVKDEWLPIEGIFVSADGCSLVDEALEARREWPRLDPYSLTGKVEPK